MLINNNMAYSQATANVLNQLIQQGLTPEQAFQQLGISDDEADAFYVIDEVGTPATNPNFGQVTSFQNFQVRDRSPNPVPAPPAFLTQNIQTTPNPVDTGGVPTQTLADFEPVQNRFAGPVTDTGGVPTQSLADIDGDTGFVPANAFAPTPVDPNYTDFYDPETGTYGIWDLNSGTAARTGLTEQQAILGAQEGTVDGLIPPNPGNYNEAALLAAEESVTKAKLANAQQQSTIQQRYNQTTRGDWRVRIRLAPQANYLYLSDDPGILAPLREADGVIFPYVPQIQTNYAAKYDVTELVHSNYRGYYYRNSHVGDITITGTFTAQDTREATYLLAVIHFFRSVTKMFYGQDPQRGAPPPLVMLSGYGEYQFNNHPCLISSFNYNLPNEVNYIPISPNNQGLNLPDRRSLVNSTPGSTIQSVINRLKNAGLTKGATPERVDLGTVTGTVNGTQRTTYVPTKIEIQLTLLPIQTRQQVSQQFSLRNFANGNQLKGGFW
jgi:hypothetical protein